MQNRRGNTADALNQQARATGTEERKENRMMMGQHVMNSGAAQKPPARFQNAAAAVLGTSNYNKPAAAMLNSTDDRRFTVGAAGMLPPSGYRGQSIGYHRGGTGGGIGASHDPFGTAGPAGSSYANAYNVPAPKIATINVRVS